MVPRKALVHPHCSNDFNFGIQGIDFRPHSCLHESDEAVEESGLSGHLIYHGNVNHFFAKSCDHLVCLLFGSAVNVMHNLPNEAKYLLDVTVMLLSQAVLPKTLSIPPDLFLEHLARPEIDKCSLESFAPLLSMGCVFLGNRR